MKSKNIITAFVALLFASSLVIAQDMEGKRFKHEFGFDASRVLNGIFQTSNFNGIMYRYHTKNGSLRVRANMDYTQNPSQSSTNTVSYLISGYTNTNTTNTNKDKQHNLNSQLRIGWQWVRESKNISAYMGEDLIIGIQSSHSGTTDNFTSDDKNNTTVTQNINTSNYKGYSYGLSSCGGVIFKLNTRLRLTVETSIDIYMTSSKNSSVDSRSQVTTNKISGILSDNNNSSSASSKDNAFHMNFIPLNMFMLSVMF